MKRQMMAELWDLFARAVIPRDASAVQRHEMRRAFYAGALTSIQDKQIATELRAIRKHGKNGARTRSVIFGARTRAINSIVELGFTFEQARAASRDAAYMVLLEMVAERWEA